MAIDHCPIDITFVRVTSREPSADGEFRRTIFAVRTSELDEAAALLAALSSTVVDHVPHEALPGVAQLASTHLAERASHTLVPIGTTVGEEWTSWHCRVLTAPPVPQ